MGVTSINATPVLRLPPTGVEGNSAKLTDDDDDDDNGLNDEEDDDDDESWNRARLVGESSRSEPPENGAENELNGLECDNEDDEIDAANSEATGTGCANALCSAAISESSPTDSDDASAPAAERRGDLKRPTLEGVNADDAEDEDERNPSGAGVDTRTDFVAVDFLIDDFDFNADDAIAVAADDDDKDTAERREASSTGDDDGGGDGTLFQAERQRIRRCNKRAKSSGCGWKDDDG